MATNQTNQTVLKSVAGWYGVLAILLAYILLTFKIIESNGLPYQLLNLTGSAGIIVTALAKKDVQPVVLNIIWSVVACVAIVRILFFK